MAITMKLVSRPRSANRMKKAVQTEVRTALTELGNRSVSELKEHVADWEDKPKFEVRVNVTATKWLMSIFFDKRTTGGKHFNWVDKGTGKRGGGQAYDIYPRRKNALEFVYPPHVPKTLPSPPIPGLVKIGPVTVNRRKHVKAPGIYPRNFTKDLRTKLKDDRKPGGFRSTLEAAVKRALRREGVYKS